MRVPSILFALPLVLVPTVSLAQTDTAVPNASAVPPIVRFSGTLGETAGTVGVRFALYREQTGGEALWAETQVAQVDASGRYSVVLGTTTALAPEVFATGEARWLGVQVAGQAERPRVLLVSVPYALKAGDAETVGGKPLSAFVLAGNQTGIGADGLTYVNPQVLKAGLQAAGGPGQTANSGTANYLGLFLNTTDLGSSVVYQDPSTQRLGVNTTAPLAAFHAASNTAPVAFFDVYSPVLTALPVAYRAARGTMLAPSAVQTDDILGGLAVRGFGSSTFSPGGRGQVAFKAAEPWTDSANGTYLQVNTTAVGTKVLTERLRVTAGGDVGIGTSTPGQLLSVAGTIESTTGGFKFPDGTTQTTAGGVRSFNGRTGAVVPTANDYTYSQIGGTLPDGALTGTYTHAVTFSSAGNQLTAASVSATSSGGPAVYGTNTSNTGTGVQGAGATGVYGQGAVYGVYGRNSSNQSYGQLGTTANSYPTGVYGLADGTSAAGVFGDAGTGTATVGVYGRSGSSTGTAVLGSATSASGPAWGVGGVSHSTAGIGIFGAVDATSGITYGVVGESTSPAGTAGVFVNTAGGKILSGQIDTNGTEVFSVAGSGNVTTPSLLLSATTGSTVGVIGLGLTPFIHACCSVQSGNTFIGSSVPYQWFA